MKKYIIICILFIILCLLAIFTLKLDLKYIKSYIPNKGNIKGNVNVEYFFSKNKDFDIGANVYGYAVFKNPKKAFETLKKEYAKGIALIRKEKGLAELTTSNYSEYGVWGWQITSGTEEERGEAAFVSMFIDIYENSFNRLF